METIKNYLEAMFANLPRTPEVIKAKDELWQMMEDKYNELRAEGRNENEAVGVVISEFGNLDELADTLGIRGAMQERPQIQGRLLSGEEVRDYVKDDERILVIIFRDQSYNGFSLARHSMSFLY